MYSAILMMALATGGQTADRHGGCCGYCGGCCGYSSYCGCCGYGWGGYSCGGCWGGYSCGGYGCGGCGGYAYGGYGYSGWGYASSSAYSSGSYVAANQAPATLIVSLPADAKLTIDDAATTSTSAQRVFVTPNLPTGQQFHYTLKAEAMVDGKPIAFSEVVTVKAGESTRVTLTPPGGVASR